MLEGARLPTGPVSFNTTARMDWPQHEDAGVDVENKAGDPAPAVQAATAGNLKACVRTSRPWAPLRSPAAEIAAAMRESIVSAFKLTVFPARQQQNNQSFALFNKSRLCHSVQHGGTRTA